MNKKTKALSNETLAEIQKENPDITIPEYDRSQLKSGIIHIGPSAFFRGHLAVYIDDILNKGNLDWGITAVSLKTSTARDALAPQDNLYTVFERDGVNPNPRIIGSIKDILVAPEDPQAVIDKMTHVDTKIVTMTVTQCGYYYNSETGQLDFDNDDIKQCLASSDEPSSTVGFLVTALEKRMKNGIPPFNVISCDNLAGNGTILKNVVLAYASQRSPGLEQWIADNVSFPNTMVDRIVPRTTDENIKECTEMTGIEDGWPIYTESFRQFVIEDTFCNDIPDLASVDALITDDVSTFELLKIRMLNGTHMAMGMIGRLCDHEYTHEAISDPDIKTFIDEFMREMKGTLPSQKRYEDQNLDVDIYQEETIQRLANPEMKDELSRLARNGLDKLDSRILMATRTAEAREIDYDNMIFTVATWITYLKKSGEIDILDEKALEKGLPEIARQCGDNPRGLLAMKDIFGSELPSSRKYVRALTAALELIEGSPSFKEALQTFNREGLHRNLLHKEPRPDIPPAP